MKTANSDRLFARSFDSGNNEAETAAQAPRNAPKLAALLFISLDERFFPTSYPFRILLVEEDNAMTGAVLSSLKGFGLQCESADSARAGMELFKACKPHLVLLGLGLPEIGGAALCQPIRAVSTVPIAVLSVRTRREDHIHALNLGADEFITMRPWDDQLMMVRVIGLLRRAYHYDKRAAREHLDTQVTAKPQSSLPEGWATCEACAYMGPQRRFERLNSLGEPALLCPHCNRAQSPRFSVV